MSAAVLIGNPQSGSGGAERVPRLLRQAGVELSGEWGIADLESAELGDADVIVVAGGDGTIAPVAERCAELGARLAVVPVGTANDFVRRLGLPQDLEDSIELIAAAPSTRQIDLARVNGRTFVNAASIGLAPEAAKQATDYKDALGSLAYAAGAVKVTADAEPIACRVRCGEETVIDGEVWQVTVACTGGFGGGSELDAVPDDGVLDVVAIEAGPKPRLAKHAFGMRTGTLEEQKGVVSERCSRIEIFGEHLDPLNVDGEVIELVTRELRFEVQPRAVELVSS